MSHLAKVEEKKRLEKLYHERSPKHFWAIYHNDKRGGILEKGYPYSTNHKNVKKWFRRQSNRRVRRSEDDILGRAEHKKHFDLWWMLW